MSKNYDDDLQEQPVKNSSILTRADALKVNENDPTTTQPLVSVDFPVMSDTVFIWDTMPLRDIDGKVLSVNGWSVIFTLTADREPENPDYIDANGNYDIALDWNNRHGRAKMCLRGIALLWSMNMITDTFRQWLT